MVVLKIPAGSDVSILRRALKETADDLPHRMVGLGVERSGKKVCRELLRRCEGIAFAGGVLKLDDEEAKILGRALNLWSIYTHKQGYTPDSETSQALARLTMGLGLNVDIRPEDLDGKASVLVIPPSASWYNDCRIEVIPVKGVGYMQQFVGGEFEAVSIFLPGPIAGTVKRAVLWTNANGGRPNHMATMILDELGIAAPVPAPGTAVFSGFESNQLTMVPFEISSLATELHEFEGHWSYGRRPFCPGLRPRNACQALGVQPGLA